MKEDYDKFKLLAKLKGEKLNCSNCEHYQHMDQTSNLKWCVKFNPKKPDDLILYYDVDYPDIVSWVICQLYKST